MIALRDIARVFQVGDQRVHALQHIDLWVKAGEYLSIMGPSGSGKSTLLNVIGLLDRPDSGDYLLDGKNVTDLNDIQQADTRRNKIGFIFQFFHLIPRLTAQENVELPMILAGIGASQRREKVLSIFKALGIADRAHHKPDQLSGGQRQRVAIARATVMDPKVILADEPTGNLDRASGLEVIEILEGLVKKGMAMIIVTHDADLGKRAHRRVRMVDGRIDTDAHYEDG